MPKVKLGDIAKERREVYKGNKFSCPVVGLEHLTPGEIRLSAWDVGGDNTFSKAFFAGDVLFGRRRAYLKKAAQATVDGLCSGDITVIQASADQVSPDLLPFIIQNDAFFEFAVENSAGSLSPRVKWEHLANFEIDLPSMDEQRKLASLLWAAYELKESYERLLRASDEMAKSRFIEMFGDSKAKFQRLGDICSVGSSKRVFVEELQTKGIPFFRGTEVGRLAEDKDIEPTLFITEEHYIALCKHTGKPKIGDLLLPSICPDGRVWCVNSERPFYFKDGRVLWVKVPDAINGCYLRFALSQSIIENYSTLASGITFAELKIVTLKEAPIPLPPLALQNEFAAFIEQLDKSKVELQKSIASTSAMIKSLLSEAMGE